MELGAFCEKGDAAARRAWDRAGITVCDFTGLGVEGLYIAEYCCQGAN